MKKLFKAFIVNILLFSCLGAKLVNYDLHIQEKLLLIDGKQKLMIHMNDYFPAPTIRAAAGDTLQVTLHNHLNENTSLHWHGVLVPNEENGVPYLTSPIIEPGKSHTFRFDIQKPGTYWYHSPYAYQQEKGLFGALAFSGESQNVYYEKERVLILSDWSHQNAEQVYVNLKKRGDYYELQNRSKWVWSEILDSSLQELHYHLCQSFKRQGPDEAPDMAYDALLINGKESEEPISLNEGGSLRLRIINAASTTPFELQYAGGPMKVIGADGQALSSQDKESLFIDLGESYDVIINRKDSKAYEFRAQDPFTGKSTSLFIGSGDRQTLPKKAPRPKYPIKKDLLFPPYHKLKAAHKTTLDPKKPVREFSLSITEDSRRYTWSFDNELFSESDPLVIRRGENIRILINNPTSAFQPFHLHGHLFRVITQAGDYSPVKHSLSVPPNQALYIEFEATKEKDWLLESTHLYRRESGLRRLVSYQEKEDNPLKNVKKLYSDRAYYTRGEFQALSHRLHLKAAVFNARNTFHVDSEYLFKQDYEHRFYYQRNITPYLEIFLGGKAEKRDKQRLNNAAFGGFSYILPMMVQLKVEVDSHDHIVASLGNSHPLSQKGNLYWQLDTDKEFFIAYRYQINQILSIGLEYNSRAYLGAGLIFSF